MKIGISIRHFSRGSGGLQQHTEELVGHLRAKGHEVTIVTRSVGKVPSYHDTFTLNERACPLSPVADDLYLLGFHSRHASLLWLVSKLVHRSRLTWAGIKLYEAVFSRPLRKAFGSVNLVHHIGQGSEMIGFAASNTARSLGIPFTIQPTIHPGQWGDGQLDFLLYRRAQALLVHTQYEAAYFAAKGIEYPRYVVGNGVSDTSSGSAEAFRSKHGISGPLILFLGRKDPDKGYPLLREAFNDLRGSYPNLSLVCAGPGKSLPTIPGVIELGYISEQEKRDALAACTLFCVPSEAESFGLVYVEAALCSKPIVALNIPVLRELWGDDAALLVGPKQQHNREATVSAEELSLGIRALLSDPKRSASLAHTAQTRAQRHLWSEVTPRFEQAFSDTFRAMAER